MAERMTPNEFALGILAGKFHHPFIYDASYTKVIDRDGIVVAELESQQAVLKFVNEALKILKRIAKTQKERPR